MSKKSDQPEQPDKEKVLEQKVDEMMAARGGDSQPAVAISVEDAPSVKSDAKASPATAPELPKDLQETREDKPVDDPVMPDLKVVPEEPIPDTSETENEDSLGDEATNKAVDDIMTQESDKLLAVDDALAARKQKQLAPTKPGWKARLISLFKNKWTWVGFGLLLVLLLAVPFTRYKILGLVIKRPAVVTVLDSQTGTPVSNAQIELAGARGKTDANGRARLNAALGPQRLIIKKQYYNAYNEAHFVGFKTAKESKVKLTATGRLVPITVINKIGGQALKNAEIKILNTTAKTNAKGQALVALPTEADTYPGKLKLGGYNPADITVQVIDKPVKANTFELTPAGRIYFLSNRDGNIDVVTANLDGSGRKTVLEGTGREDANTTSLLASRDWKYLVLKARREGAQPALYLIDTATDKVTLFDNGNAEFNLVGWYGHSFIYELTRRDLSNWQAGRQQLKSYDAKHLQLNQLDQTQAEGAAGKYAYQNFYNFYIVDGAIVYNTQWSLFDASGQTYDTNGKSDTIRAVQSNGQNKKDYQSLPAGSTGYFQAALYEPGGVYYSVYNNSDNKTAYYVYEDQTVKPATLDPGAFNRTYPTFLVSPGGKHTLWTELRDGKNALFTGDANAKHKKQIANLSAYAPYGWFSDDYLLVSKNSSELYAIPAGGLKVNRQPLKITDYYKPAQTFNGYGYGYGGL